MFWLVTDTAWVKAQSKSIPSKGLGFQTLRQSSRVNRDSLEFSICSRLQNTAVARTSTSFASTMFRHALLARARVEQSRLVVHVAVPPGVLIPILPVFAPVGPVTTTCVSETTVKLARIPPKVTSLPGFRLTLVTITTVPTEPLDRVNVLRRCQNCKKASLPNDFAACKIGQTALLAS